MVTYLRSLVGEELDLDVSQSGSEKNTLCGWAAWDIGGR